MQLHTAMLFTAVLSWLSNRTCMEIYLNRQLLNYIGLIYKGEALKFICVVQ